MYGKDVFADRKRMFPMSALVSPVRTRGADSMKFSNSSIELNWRFSGRLSLMFWPMATTMLMPGTCAESCFAVLLVWKIGLEAGRQV